MSNPDHAACAECGARLADGAEVCDLCGAAVATDAATAPEPAAPPVAALEPEPAAASEPPPAAPPAPATRPPGVFCNECGWQNPPAARFCSMCGTRLQQVAGGIPAAPAPVAAPVAAPVPAAGPSAEEAGEPAPAGASGDRQAVSRQVGIIIGAGVLLVVALFLVTAVSKQQPRPSAEVAQPSAGPPPPSATALPPLPAQLEGQVAALEDEVAGLEGAARTERQRALVSLLFNAGRPDRAALAQRDVAEATDLVEDWKRVGDLFYDWMNMQEGGLRSTAAQQAIDAYQRVLEADPGNLDVRTDMATAYLSSNNPMQGVQEIKRVLEADSTHLQARFNYGIMLAMIGRADQAVAQFERVKAQVGTASPYYDQADEAIRSVKAGASL